MIHLDRGFTPAFFSSKAVMEQRKRAEAFFQQPPTQRAQTRFDFQKVASNLHPAIRRELTGRFPAKCAYCETPVEKPEIETFRPKQRATGLDGKVDDDHYWWLAFEWANYLLACRQCNTLKGSRFPVTGQRAPVGSTDSALASERRLLLDPSEDAPEGILLFLDDGRMTSSDERGQVTIDIVGLNRDALVKARQEDLVHLLPRLPATHSLSERAVGKVVAELKPLISDASPYAAMRRQYVRAWAVEAAELGPSAARHAHELLQLETALHTSLKSRRRTMQEASTKLTARKRDDEAYSVMAAHVPDQYYRQTRFIERFELRNVRAFESLQLRMPIGSSERGEWLMLLGENGSGKSSVLQALACALVGQAGVKRLGVKATDLLRRGSAKGEIRVHLTGMSAPIVVSLARRGNTITVDPPDPKVMVLAYGATRLLSEGNRRASRSSRVEVRNLFDPLARLSDGRPWLYEAPKREFDRFARSLSSLLPRSDGVRFSRRAGRVYVEAPGVRDTLESLSSGYQAVLALALDIMSVMRLGWEDMEGAEGIVLIDEVDAHLHPRWKMRIVRCLRDVFPRLQFIATSHEPLTLRGIERDEVAVLRRALDGSVAAVTAETDDLPSPKLMRVDQLLTSEFFGLNSTEDLEVDTLFEKYYRLLATRARTPRQEQQLAELRARLDGSGQLGLTQRERLALDAADAYIVERREARQALPVSVREGARARLQRIWADLDGGLAKGKVDR